MFSVYPIPSRWFREYIALSYYHHQIGNMNYYPLFRVRSCNNGMRCMSFIFFWRFYLIYPINNSQNVYRPILSEITLYDYFFTLTFPSFNTVLMNECRGESWSTKVEHMDVGVRFDGFMCYNCIRVTGFSVHLVEVTNVIIHSFILPISHSKYPTSIVPHLPRFCDWLFVWYVRFVFMVCLFAFPYIYFCVNPVDM